VWIEIAGGMSVGAVLFIAAVRRSVGEPQPSGAVAPSI
jgi:hypothetical protein